jgi:predicted nucleic acid-binding protein
VSRALLDTSIFVAREQERALARALPDEVAVSVVTLAELEVGVLVARDDPTRARRLRTLVAARERAAGLPVDQRVASAYAQLAAVALRAGRRPRIHDTWIAATAAVYDAAVWTQDDDFTEFHDVEVVRV